MGANTLIDGLLYKSEGTDLDFKSAQYRFVKGSAVDKAELLKDVLAMANAWRDGIGYILIGFKDRRPHPAELVGINGHLDDAAIQQFVHGKVKPKLTFHYEERLYEGKTIGVIAIPKQPRPFYISHPYGPLKSNVVYVRRGSSTDEAEPPEIAKMMEADAGRGTAAVDLSVLDKGNVPLAESVELRFLSFEELPDYASQQSSVGPFGPPTIWHDNRHYWREAAEYVRVKLGAVELNFELTNRSAFALTNTKLEVTVEPVEGQAFEMIAGQDMPDEPENSWGVHYGPPVANFNGRADSLVIDHKAGTPVCHVRFGTVLPGETSRAPDTLAVLPSAAGLLRIRLRVLAGELASPVELERELEVTGPSELLNVDSLEDILYGPPKIS